MWEKTYSKTYQGVKKDAIWRLWTDINNWPRWNPMLASCELDGPFEQGQAFTLTPKKGPKAQLTLVEVTVGTSFTDCTKFPGATMYGSHKIVAESDGLCLVITMTITGPLSWIWRKLVVNDIVAKIPHQTDALVALARG